MSQGKKIRVLVGKLGLNGHDRGAKVLSLILRNAGMEVIYTGLRRTPEYVVKTAIEEDVEVICLSFMSGAHLALTKNVMDLLEREGVKDSVKVLVGGTIPDRDIPKLEDMGVVKVFQIGVKDEEIIEYIRSMLGSG
ncbi:MAG: cobalamin B12-binding domain-containing protein [Candidatus Geothermarchaeales archaeon]